MAKMPTVEMQQIRTNALDLDVRANEYYVKVEGLSEIEALDLMTALTHKEPT